MDGQRKAVVTSAGALITALVAVVGALKGHAWLSVVLPVVEIPLLLTLAAVWLSDVVNWFGGWRVSRRSADDRGKPKQPFVGLWRNSTDGADAPNVSINFNKSVNHPGYANRETALAKVVLVVLVPCGPLGEMCCQLRP